MIVSKDNNDNLKPISPESIMDEDKVELKNDENMEQPSTVDLLLNFLGNKIKKIVISSNDSSTVYALISVKDHFETIDLSSNQAIDWLKANYYMKNFKVFSDEDYKKSLGLIRAKSRFDDNVVTESIYKRAFLRTT